MRSNPSQQIYFSRDLESKTIAYYKNKKTFKSKENNMATTATIKEIF